MYFLGIGREIRSTHIVLFRKTFPIDSLEYTLSGPKSKLFNQSRKNFLNEKEAS